MKKFILKSLVSRLILLNFITFFPINLFASEFFYTCASDKDWIMNFIINTDEKSVFLVSSGDTKGSRSYNTKNFENVVRFTEKEISIYAKYDSNLSYRTFFLDKNIMLNTGHYPDGEIHNQIFNCFKG